MGQLAEYQNFSNDQWDLIIGYDNNENPITLREYVNQGKESTNLTPISFHQKMNQFTILGNTESTDLKKKLALDRINNVKEFADFVHPELGIVTKESAINIIENDLKGSEELIHLELEQIEFILNSINTAEQ